MSIDWKKRPYTRPMGPDDVMDAVFDDTVGVLAPIPEYSSGAGLRTDMPRIVTSVARETVDAFSDEELA